MPENDIEKRKRKLIQRKQKEGEEKEVENRKDNFLTIEPFSIHDWDKDFSIIALEQRAKQLAREYQALKAIHDYSEKLHELKEHMAKESETSIETQNEDFGFEVEADEETINNVEMFSKESETTCENLSMEEDVDFEVDSSNSDSNVDLGAHDVNIEVNVEASDVSSEIGSIDVGLNSSSGLSGSQGTGSGNVGSGSCGSSGSGSSGGG